MTELALYSFIYDNGIEYHWTNDLDVIIFVYIRDLDEWKDILGSHIFDEEGIRCTMKDGYFCFEMKDICEHFDIELSNIFNKEGIVFHHKSDGRMCKLRKSDFGMRR